MRLLCSIIRAIVAAQDACANRKGYAYPVNPGPERQSHPICGRARRSRAASSLATSDAFSNCAMASPEWSMETPEFVAIGGKYLRRYLG